ncbi:putative odorant receptor 92a isoform X1 [Vespa velutina]|uniref:putative odorant receptor 92a isoform X1 n=1 Tax=Vespa velutina TaxID=202808 RepID=UPI001FB2159F|nr:putative odorant receptor 92a isoform X1 [Vespa velutina]
MSINFQNTNRLNVLANLFSGNVLPITSDGSELSLLSELYAISTWIIVLIYTSGCIIGIFRVPKEYALRESTVNLIIIVEIFFNLFHMYRQRNLLKRLIGNYNFLFSIDNDLLKTIVVTYVGPVEKMLKFYTITEVSTVVLWVSTAFITFFQKEEFVHEDYVLPISFSEESISRNVYIINVIIEIFGSFYVILKKVSTDIYTLHLILLLTSQYKYMRIKFGMVFRRKENSLKSKYLSDRVIEKELDSLFHHHSVVVRATIMLKEILSFNVCIIHLDSVFRFCFLSFMLATNMRMNIEGFIIISYSIAAVLQLYMICFYVQELFEAGTKLTDDAFNEEWYSCELSVKKNFQIMIHANKLKCQLTPCQSVDLSLPSFMQIMNQAYSVCLLFLKMK